LSRDLTFGRGPQTADRPAQRDSFQARGDIDTVAHEVAAALLNDIAKMDADPIFDALFGRESPSASLRTGVRRIARQREAGAARSLRGPPRSQVERMLAMLPGLEDLRQGAITG
jgi:hypothetical protein